MKKVIIILFILVIFLVGLNEQKHFLIPKDAIRFRIIANSDTNFDQKTKTTIKNKVETEIYKLLDNVQDISTAREIIANNLDKIDNIMQNYDTSYDISYGDNYFPEKTYKGITYKAGNYESLVITLGEGKGHNWWCVLFPPLCLLDEQENLDNAQYEFYATKLINKFK